MKATLATLTLATLSVACAPKAVLEPVHDSFSGSYNVLVQDASSGFDRAQFDASLVLAVEKLKAVYGPDVETKIQNVFIHVQDAPVPCDAKWGKCKGLTSNPDTMGHMTVYLSLWYALDGCDAATKLAHELSHAMRRTFEGDGDHDHHDKRFFEDDCNDETCKDETLEHLAEQEGLKDVCGE